MSRVSLRIRLLTMISGVLIAVLVPLGIYSFLRTTHEVREVLDGRLVQDARTLALQVHNLQGTHAPLQFSHDTEVPVIHGPAAKSDPHGRTYESEVGFQICDNSGHVILASQNLEWLAPPKASDAGFEEMDHGKRSWRMYTLLDTEHGYIVRVAERRDSRRDIARGLWIEHGLTLLLGLPLLIVLMSWAIGRGLRPLNALTEALQARAPGSRQPIVLDAAPTELTTVVAALNGQLARLEDAIERERRFSADVAHELRTPLASSMIHLDNLATSQTPADANAALVCVRRGLDALARRVEQLLALARIEAGVAHPRTHVDLVAIAMTVMEELAPLIANSHVELGFICEEEHILLHGYEAALMALIRNLLDNALRHVPNGGHVQLKLTQSKDVALIEVIDNGPGIPADRRDSVFKRFHREKNSRGDGYGLGLSIVQRAAELHDAAIELSDSPWDTGLCVTVLLPRR